jgi:large subunit ribosomal protein L7/L12
MSNDKVVDISKHRPATVYLQSYNQNKVHIIKIVRDEFGLGLADAKNLVENAPCEVGSFATRTAAERFKAMLEGAGADVELHRDQG